MDSKIDELFGKLDRWRHLPSYQLERRADIFISLYLSEVLELELGRRPKHIIPEFPVWVSIKDPEAKSNRSVKLDYLAVMQDPAGLVLVELKTDPASINEEQIRYLIALRTAQKKDNSALLRGLQKIYGASSAKHKYLCLHEEVEKAGLVDPPQSRIHFEPRQDLPKPLEAQILFIKPDAKPIGRGITVVPFTRVAKIILDAHNDELSVRFAQSLREWGEKRA